MVRTKTGKCDAHAGLAGAPALAKLPHPNAAWNTAVDAVRASVAALLARNHLQVTQNEVQIAIRPASVAWTGVL